MRTLFAILVPLCAALRGLDAADPPRPYDLDFVVGFLAGDYVLIGRKPELEATYTGRMVLRKTANGLEFTRTVGADTQSGTVVLDTKADEGGKPVLRIRFSLQSQPYEATYLWSSDLSNFARLTGYVYSTTQGKTKFPGLEALFLLVDYNRKVNQ
jgi:hypothetical protein